MSDDEQPDYLEALEQLNSELDGLDAALEPLFESTLADVLAKSDKPLERAKMSATLAFTMHDLMWSASGGTAEE